VQVVELVNEPLELGHGVVALVGGDSLIDGEGDDQLPGDGMGCGLDGGKDLRPALGIEFVPVEAEEEAFEDSFRGGLWVLFPNGRFDESPRGRVHRAPHLETLFARSFHEHGPVAVVHFWWCIFH